MRELAARLGANPSNVTVAVGRLEAKGLVSRQGSEDRRVRGVLLTDRGRDLRRRLELRLAEDHPAVRGLSPSQREALARILRRLSEQPRALSRVSRASERRCAGVGGVIHWGGATGRSPSQARERRFTWLLIRLRGLCTQRRRLRDETRRRASWAPNTRIQAYRILARYQLSGLRTR